MFRTILALTVATAALPIGPAGALVTSQTPAPARTREVYVSVQSRNDTPVTGLTPADFVVREDGAPREVLKAERATAPVQIMLLVDDSAAADPAVSELRSGLNAFVDKMQGKGEIGLVTIGERPTSVTELTPNHEMVKKGLSRIFARPGSGAYFLEALSDVARGLQRREAARPIVVAVITEGVEFSNMDSTGVLDRLYPSRATLHVLSIGRPNDSMADEIRHRNIVIADGTERTGGRRDQVLTPSALPEKLRKLADEIINQYVVTYGVPEALIPPERLEVTVKQPGVTVRARQRLPAPPRPAR
jgi:VWFA-related protein